MEALELHRHAEHAVERARKEIGLTTAIGAVLLAVATMLGNRTHVKEGKLQTEITGLMSSYNSKHSLTHTFSADMQQAELTGKIDAMLAAHLGANGKQQAQLLEEIRNATGAQVAQYLASGKNEDEEADDINRKTLELEAQAELIEHSGDIYSLAELCLQVSIVLCSIALLAESGTFWKMSFLSSAAGVALVLYGLALQ